MPASAVRVVRRQNETPRVDGRAPTICAIVGVCERGPIGEIGNDNLAVTSFAEWQEIYGGFTLNARDLPLSAKRFFDEGGQLLYTVRVVHTTTIGDPTTKTSASATISLDTETLAPSAGFVLGTVTAPFALLTGDDLDIAIDGGGPAAATFTGAAASRTGAATAPYTLADGQTLTLSINGGAVQTITFLTSSFVDIGNATTAEVNAVINAGIVGAFADDDGGAPRITTDRKGTSASINVTGGTANGELGFTTGLLSGTGNVADLDAITVAEVKTIVEAAVAGCTVTDVGGAVRIASNTTGPTSSVQVQASSTADDELGFDNAVHTGNDGTPQPTLKLDGKWDGAYANALSVLVSAPASGTVGVVDLALLQDGVVVESWRDGSMDPDDPNYLVTLINEGGGGQQASLLVTATDLISGFDPPDGNPALGTFGPMSGGDDGLAGLVDADFYGGSAGDNKATGLRVLDRISRIDALAIPGRVTGSVLLATVTYCDITREGRTFAVFGSPEGFTITQMRAFILANGLKGLTEQAAGYYPRDKVDNPAPDVYGTETTLVAPVEGGILGVYSRIDATKEGGAFTHPSNLNGVLFTSRGIESDEIEDQAKRGLLFDDRWNAVRAQSGKPRQIDGARTLKATGPFPSVGSSRGAMFIANTLIEAFDDFRNSAITLSLLKTLEGAARLFLERLTANLCFRTTNPTEAFFVDFSEAINTPAVADTNTVKGVVGINDAPPAEFIDITIVPFRGLEQQFNAAA